jgi:hypothetical protein
MIEVIKQLVDALETYGDKHRKTYLLEGAWDGEITKGDAAIEAGKKAIKELESQEPVAWVAEDVCEGQHIDGRPRKIWWECEKGVGMAFYTHPSQRTEPPDWFPAVENILNEYGLQAIDFVADFKAAMKDAEQSQRTWVGLTNKEVFEICYSNYYRDSQLVKMVEAKLKEKNT